MSPRGPATPPRRPHEAQGSGHAPLAATGSPGDRPCPHGGHTKPRGRPRREPPRFHHNHTKQRGTNTTHRGHLKLRGPATPPRRPQKHDRTRHALTAATRTRGNSPRPHASTRTRGDRHATTAATNPKVPATYPLRPQEPKATRDIPTVAARTRGNPPQPNRGHTNPRGPVTPLPRPNEPEGTCHATTGSHEADWTRHAPTTSTQSRGDLPRSHRGHTKARRPATPLPRPHEAEGNLHAPTTATRRRGGPT